MATVQQFVAVHNARRRRRKNRLRGFLGPGHPDYRITKGAAVASPVSDAEGEALATLAWDMEFFDGTDYPDGTLLDTGEMTVVLDAAGSLTVEITLEVSVTLTVDLTDPAIFGSGKSPTGTHTIMVVSDPPNNRIGLWVDGVQVGADVGSGYTLWADNTQTWEYMETVSDIGIERPLQVYPGIAPANYVPA